MSTPEHTVPPIRPLAGLAALVLPGLGHLVLGETKRGVLIAIGVLGLFFGGLFIGGIDSVDSKEDKVWFFGQALVGPLAFGVDYIHQNQFKVKDTDFSGNIVGRSARPNEGRDPATGRAIGASLGITRDQAPGGKGVLVRGVTPGTGAEKSGLKSGDIIFKWNETLVAGPDDLVSQLGSIADGNSPQAARLTIQRGDQQQEVTVGLEPVKPPNIKSLAKVNEIGTLFSTIAGMLNLIVIMDALLPIRRPRHVGLQTTLADTTAPLNAPATVQDPHRGEMPKA
jgi:membrane-associated protease RseP (regulator of RpoE activity)